MLCIETIFPQGCHWSFKISLGSDLFSFENSFGHAARCSVGGILVS